MDFEHLILQEPANLDLIQYKLNQSNSTVIDEYLTTEYEGATPLWVACLRNNTDLISLLINNGADINKLCKDNEFCKEESPLHLVSRLNNISCLKTLLDPDDPPNINIEKSDGTTPIFLAVKEDNLDSVILLLENGADINIVRKDMVSPLLLAVQNNCINVLSWLIYESGIPKIPSETRWINFNVRDRNGITPFNHTVRLNLKLSFNLLCGVEGVSMVIPDTITHKTPLEYAIGDGDFEMVYGMLLAGLYLTYEHLENIHKVWSIWSWCNSSTPETAAETTLIQNIFLRCTNPLIYGRLAINPFILEPDGWNYNWDKSIEMCKYWKPHSLLYSRLPQDIKDRILLFLMIMKRLGKNSWMELPKPLLYNIIEDFTKPNINNISTADIKLLDMY